MQFNPEEWGNKMTKSIRTLLLVSLSCFTAVGVSAANSKKPTNSNKKPEQIVVTVHKAEKGLIFEVKSDEYKKGDANYLLAELKLQKGGDCQIIAVVDDRVPLSAITEISEMAINAGFKDIRPFVLWHKTGRMAQIQFGPAIKFTQDPDKIAKREKAQ
jgi:biopolymer transport protein ExbD